MSFIKYIMDGVHFKLIIIDSTIAYVGCWNGHEVPKEA